MKPRTLEQAKAAIRNILKRKGIKSSMISRHEFERAARAVLAAQKEKKA